MVWSKWVLVCLFVVFLPGFISAQIIINEIHADPVAGLAGDANGDGVRSADDDEFVELVNSSGSDIDISGWTLSDAAGVKHTFPDGTIVPANCAIVVFGGGTPTGQFGNALVQTTSSLGLNNSGDTVSLSDGVSVIATHTYGSEANDDQSITRDPDITGGFSKHAAATGAGGALFSPGTGIDGSGFSGCSPGAGTGNITITKSTKPTGGTAFPFTGDLGPFNLDDGQSQTFTDLPEGNYSISELIPTGWSLDSIVVSGGGSTKINDGIDIILQAGDDIQATFHNTQLPPPTTSVIINEIDSDTPGTDDMELIELFDSGSGNTSLDGLVLVLFNGGTDQSYAAFSLDGQTTDSNGFFVMGSSGLPNVDFVLSNSTLQNGPDAAALYFGNASDFPNGTPVTTMNLIDAVVYGTSDPDDPGLLSLLSSGQPQLDENSAGDKDNHSLQRIPNGAGSPLETKTYLPVPPTPGEMNRVPSQPKADLEVDMSIDDDDDPVHVGDTIEYRIAVSNEGPDTATDVILAVTLSRKTSLISISTAQGSCTEDNQGVTCKLLDLKDDSRVKIKLLVSADEAGTATQFVGVASDIEDPNPDDNEASEKITIMPARKPDISVAHEILDFDEVVIGDQLDIDLIIKNRGNAELIVDSTNVAGPDADAWLIAKGAAPFKIGTRGDHKIQLCFKPKSAGSKTATLRILSNDPNDSLLEIQLAGIGLGPALVADPERLDFGKVAAGQFKQIDFNLFNLGNHEVRITRIEVGGSNAEQFSLLNSRAAFTLPAGESRKHEVIFAPDSIGELRGQVRFYHKAPDEKWFAVSMRGEGLPGSKVQPEISVTPRGLHFGLLEVNTSVTKTVQITNKATGILEITDIKLAGPDSTEWRLTHTALPIRLFASQIYDLQIQFLPTTEGQKEVTLIITSDDPATSRFLVALRGRAVPQQADSPYEGFIVINEIHYNPSSMQGSDRQFEFVELSSNLDFDFELAGFRFSSGIQHVFQSGDSISAGGFFLLSVDSSSYTDSRQWDSGSLLNTGEELLLTDFTGKPVDSLHYGITDPWPAAANGGGPSLELIDSVLDNSNPTSWQASLIFGGTPGEHNSKASPKPGEIMVKPTHLIFTELTVGQTADLPVNIMNVGNGELEIKQATIIGRDSGDWEVTAGYPPFALMPGEQKTLQLTFAPADTGVKTAAVVLSNNDPENDSLSIPLDGRAISNVLPTQVADLNGKVPDTFALQQNYPNPFNATTQIRFELPNQSQVSISLFNTKGQLIRNLVEQTFPAGSHFVIWDGLNVVKQPVASGVYLIVIQAQDFVQARKMTLLR